MANDESFVDQVYTDTAKEMAKKVIETGAVKLGAQHVARATARELTRYAGTVASRGAEGSLSVATAQAGARYVTNVAASKAAAETMTKVAGRAGGVVAGPIVEMILLKCDGQDHNNADYVKAAHRGFLSGAAGAVAASLAAGAAAGPLLPFFAAAIAGHAVNSWLKG